MKRSFIFFVVMLLLASVLIVGCGKQDTVNGNNENTEQPTQEDPIETPQVVITEQEAQEAILDIYKRLCATAGVDKEAFFALYTDNTAEAVIDQDFNVNYRRLDDFDGHDVSVFVIEGNKVYGNIFLYFVSGSGTNTSSSSIWMWLPLVKQGDEWKISYSDDIINWLDKVSNNMFSEEARNLPNSQRWHNNNPTTTTGFVVPGAYIVEPKELYYAEDGGLVFNVFFSNGFDRNITVNRLSEFVITDMEQNVILDLSNSAVNIPLKSGKSAVYQFTLSPDKVKENIDLTKGFAWNLGTNYNY